MVARFFDDPALAETSEKIRSLRVRHTPSPSAGARAQAELLVAWMGSRLGWSTEGEDVLRGDGHRIDVNLVVEEREGVRPGAIHEVSISAGDSGEELLGVVKRERDAEHFAWSIATQRASLVPHLYAVPHRSDTDLVLRAAEDAIYGKLTKDALAFARRWGAVS